MNRIIFVVGPDHPGTSLDRGLAARPGPAWDRVDRLEDERVRALVATYDTVEVDRGAPGLVSERGLVVAFDGLLTNYDELVRLTGAAPGETQPRLVARAYRRWGAATPRMLEGDFAFVIHDRATRETFAAVDPLANRMLHHARDGERLVIATEPRACARALGLRLAPDLGLTINAIVGYPVTRSSSLYERVSHLAAGTSRTWCGAASEERVHFAPEPSFDASLLERDALGRVECALDRSVRARLPATAPFAVLVSGGLDSTVVAALAARSSRALRRPPPLLLHYATDLGDADESPLARRLASTLGLGLVEVHAREVDAPGSPPHDFAGVAAHGFQRLLGIARDRGVRVILTGEGSDDPQSSTTLECEDALARGRWAAAARFAGLAAAPFAFGSWRKLLRASVDPLLPRRLVRRRGRARFEATIPSWVTPRGVALVRASLERRARVEDGFDHVSPHRRALAANLVFAPGPTIGSQLWNGFAAEQGIELRHPFFTREVLSLMLSVPTEQAYDHDVAKPFTRRLAARLVPADLAWRRPPSDYTPALAATTGTVEELRAALERGRLGDLGLVGHELARSLALRDGHERLTFEEHGCLQAEAWLGTLDVRAV